MTYDKKHILKNNCLKYYFLLQYKRVYRLFKDFGIEPFLGYPILLFLFYWMSMSVFDSVLYANYIYVFISAVVAYALSSSEQRDFLKQHFSVINYRKFIVFANVLKVSPFALFLLYKAYVVEALLVYILAFFVSFMPKTGKLSVILPTPFGKKPAEFVIGFRKTFWLFLLIYGLAIIAVYVGNFNLGAFALIAVFLVCSRYYMKLDPEFYIWVHAMNSKEFIKYKITIALRYSLGLSIPVGSILGVFYPNQMHFILFFLSMGCLYLSMYVLIRYAFQQQGLEILQGVIGALCIIFPPVMIIAIPYFYKKAIQNLNVLLK